MRTAQGVERQRVELGGVVRADVREGSKVHVCAFQCARIALDVGLVDGRRQPVQGTLDLPRWSEQHTSSWATHGGPVRAAQGVERQRVELDGVVRTDVCVALDVGLVEALQARRRGRVRASHVDRG